MNERVVSYGENNDLTGVISLPVSRRKNCLPVLLLNAGFLHRTGFNRFNTDIARILASKGIPSLRFDLHGIGDSAYYNGSFDYDTLALKDIKESIGFLLAKTDSRGCILVGLCSGADYSHMVAIEDLRVHGTVLLDGYAFPTLGFYLRDNLPGLFNPRKIVARIVKKAKKLLNPGKMATPAAVVHEEENYIRTFPPRKKTIRELQTMINRGVHFLFVYSGGIPVYYNYEKQFYDMFRSVQFRNRVRHAFFKDADHTYTRVSVRKQLMATVVQWLEERNAIPL